MRGVGNRCFYFCRSIMILLVACTELTTLRFRNSPWRSKKKKKSIPSFLLWGLGWLPQSIGGWVRILCVCVNKNQLNKSPILNLLLSHCGISYHKNDIVRDRIQFVRFCTLTTIDLRYRTCKTLKECRWGVVFLVLHYNTRSQRRY